MAHFAVYTFAAGGAYLILLGVVVRATGTLYHLVAKIVPILLGVAVLWFSALALAGGA